MLGNLACEVLPYANISSVSAGSFLICAMTTFKMLSLKYPFKFARIPTKIAHTACLACWTVAAVAPILSQQLSEEITYFSYRSYQCDISSITPLQFLKPVLSIFFVVIPSFMVVANTSYILAKAIKTARTVRGDLKWQGTVATLFTALFYVLSPAPIIIYRLLEYTYISEDKMISYSFVHFYRIGVTFPFINTISNFYIYCLTITSFREFVFSVISRSTGHRSARNIQPSYDNRK